MKGGGFTGLRTPGMVTIEVSPADLMGLVSGELAHVIVEDGQPKVRVVCRKRHDPATKAAALIARATYLSAMSELYGRDLTALKALAPPDGC